MLTACLGLESFQHLQARAGRPECLGAGEVAGRAGDPQMS
jgi:hypothetical protein